jgi:hypothetical protein
MVEAIERSIVRLRLESQGEFIAIINAIEVQLESKETVAEVVRLLIESLRALAHARDRGTAPASPRSTPERAARPRQPCLTLRPYALNNYIRPSVEHGTVRCCATYPQRRSMTYLAPVGRQSYSGRLPPDRMPLVG